MSVKANTFKGEPQDDFEGTVYRVEDIGQLDRGDRRNVLHKIKSNTYSFYQLTYWKSDGEDELFFTPETQDLDDKITFYYGNIERTAVKEETEELDTSNKRDRKAIEKICYQYFRHSLDKQGLWRKSYNRYLEPEYESTNKFRLYRGIQFRFDVTPEGEILLTADSTSSYTYKKPLRELTYMNDFDDKFFKRDHDGRKRWALVDYKDDKTKVQLERFRHKAKISEEKIDHPDYDTVYDYQMKEKIENPDRILEDESVLMARPSPNRDPLPYPSGIVYPFANTDEVDNYTSGQSIVDADERVGHTLTLRKKYINGLYPGDWAIEFDSFFADFNSEVFDLPSFKFGDGEVTGYSDFSVRSWRYIKKEGLADYGANQELEFHDLFFAYPSTEDREDVVDFYNQLKSVAEEYNFTFPPEEHVKFDEIEPGNYSELISRFQKYDTNKYPYMLAIIPENGDEAYKSVKKTKIKSQVINDIYHKVYDGNYDESKLLATITGIKGETGYPWILDEDLSGNCIVGLDVSDRDVWSYSFTFGKKGERLGATGGDSLNSETIDKDRMKDGLKQVVNVDYNKTEPIERIIIHRDGELLNEEKEGLEQALEELKGESDVVDEDTELIALDIRKSTAYRLFDSEDEDNMDQPKTGSFVQIDESTGLLTTLGKPFVSQGTSNPILISVEMANCDYDLSELAKDILYLSELNWMNPTRNMRIPVTIRFAEAVADMREEGLEVSDIAL
jgi:hypothetical protein